MDQQLRVLQSLPFPPNGAEGKVWSDFDDLMFEIEGETLDRRDIRVQIRARDCLAFRFRAWLLGSESSLDSYSDLSEVFASRWIEEVSAEAAGGEPSRPALRHFVIDIDEDGVYEFIARDAEMKTVWEGEPR